MADRAARLLRAAADQAGQGRWVREVKGIWLSRLV
jgi:hypothetical protein